METRFSANQTQANGMGSPLDETRTTNRQNLERMDEEGDIDPLRVKRAHRIKMDKIAKWTHHQPDSELASEPSP